jgi:hypothetical protein
MFALDGFIEVYSPGGHVGKFRKLALTTATSIGCSSAWTNELARFTIDEWFDIIQAFIPPRGATHFRYSRSPITRGTEEAPILPQ